MPLKDSFIESFNKLVVALGGKPIANSEDRDVLEKILMGITRSVKKEVLKELNGENKSSKEDPQNKRFAGTNDGNWDQEEEDQRQTIIMRLNKYYQKIPEEKKEDFEKFLKTNKLNVYPTTYLSKLRVIEREVVIWLKKNDIKIKLN